jgi:hypothetical protein
MIRTRALLLGWFIVALAFPQRAWAVTTAEGSDASGMMSAAPMLDKTTHRVKCEQATRGPTVKLPGSSATAWNACASVTTTYADYCGNVANGIPCLDSNTKVDVSVLPASVQTGTGVTGYFPVWASANQLSVSKLFENGNLLERKTVGAQTIMLYAFSATASAAASIYLNKSLGATLDSLVTTTDGTTLGSIYARGVRTDNAYGTAGWLQFVQNGSATATGIPARLRLYLGNSSTTWPLVLDVTSEAATFNVPLKLNGATSGTVTIQPAAAAGTWSLTLPTTAGSSGQVLQTNGSGVTTWASVLTPGMELPRTIYYAFNVSGTSYALGSAGSDTTSSTTASVTSTPSVVVNSSSSGIGPGLVFWPAGSYRVRLWAGMASVSASVYITVAAGSTVIATSPTITVATGGVAPYELVATATSDYHSTSPAALLVKVYASSASANNMTIGYGGDNATMVVAPWSGFSIAYPSAPGTETPGVSGTPARSDHVHPAQTHASDDLLATTEIGASGGDYAWAYRTGTDTTTNTATGTSTRCPLNRNCTMVRTSTTTATATVTNSVNGHAISGNPVLVTADLADGLARPSAPPYYCGGEGTALTSPSPGTTQCTSVVPPSRTVCGHALYSNVTCTASDVGADASGAATSAVNAAVNGTSGYLAYFSGTHTVASAYPAGTTPNSGYVPVADSAARLDGWVSGYKMVSMAMSAAGPSADLTTDSSWDNIAAYTVPYYTGATTIEVDADATIQAAGGGAGTSCCIQVLYDDATVLGGNSCFSVPASMTQYNHLHVSGMKNLSGSADGHLILTQVYCAISGSGTVPAHYAGMRVKLWK